MYPDPVWVGIVAIAVITLTAFRDACRKRRMRQLATIYEEMRSPDQPRVGFVVWDRSLGKYRAQWCDDASTNYVGSTPSEALDAMGATDDITS